MSISTHVLDAAGGHPAAGVAVRLARREAAGWTEVAGASTDADGRVRDLAEETPVGVYRLTFDIEGYLGPQTFYPEVSVVFRVADPAAHQHVPLLLSPYAYSTYRGS